MCQHLNNASHDPYKAKADTMTLYRFRLIPVRSPLLRESHSISFPGTTKRFYFVPCVPLSGAMILLIAGCPIRKSGPQRLFAPPPGLSQLTTSFIHFSCQGIHQGPLLTCIPTFKLLHSKPIQLINASYLHQMEMVGFEPTTSCLQSRRSPTELHPLTLRIPDNGPHWI